MPGADTIRKTPVLTIILVSYLMIVLDISITITALPSIRDDLDFSTANHSWVQTAYTLGFGSSTVPLRPARPTSRSAMARTHGWKDDA